MVYYQKHVFFCTNQREAGKECCQNADASALCAYAKEQIKEKGLMGKGKTRINTAGCLDRCKEGPVMVIYPEGVWYTYRTQADIDEIIERHIQGGEIVTRLLLQS